MTLQHMEMVTALSRVSHYVLELGVRPPDRPAAAGGAARPEMTASDLILRITAEVNDELITAGVERCRTWTIWTSWICTLYFRRLW